ncbi:hypothetical protein ACFLT7_06425 [candidate division KSB1 bacterium]
MRLRSEASEGAVSFLYFVGVVMAVTGVVNLFRSLEFMFNMQLPSIYLVSVGLVLMISAYFISREFLLFLVLAFGIWLFQTYWFFNLLYGYFFLGDGMAIFNLSVSQSIFRVAILLFGVLFHLLPFALFIRSLPTKRKRAL